jgi:hypothetical protein
MYTARKKQMKVLGSTPLSFSKASLNARTVSNQSVLLQFGNNQNAILIEPTNSKDIFTCPGLINMTIRLSTPELTRSLADVYQATPESVVKMFNPKETGNKIETLKPVVRGFVAQKGKQYIFEYDPTEYREFHKQIKALNPLSLMKILKEVVKFFNRLLARFYRGSKAWYYQKRY